MEKSLIKGMPLRQGGRFIQGERRIHRTEATVVTEGAWSGIKDLLLAFGRRLPTWFSKFEVVADAARPFKILFFK